MLAEILTDFPERFAQNPKAFLLRGNSSPVPIGIEQAWPHKGRVVLKFAGIDSISAADELRGADLAVSAADRVTLDAGQIYIHDLVGCHLIDGNQPSEPVIGTIGDVVRQQDAADLLVVAGTDGVEHWIPFAKSYSPRWDSQTRRLTMNLPTGLLRVNEPSSPEEIRDRQSENANHRDE